MVGKEGFVDCVVCQVVRGVVKFCETLELGSDRLTLRGTRPNERVQCDGERLDTHVAEHAERLPRQFDARELDLVVHLDGARPARVGDVRLVQDFK